MLKKRMAVVTGLLLFVWLTIGTGSATAGFSAVMDYHVADAFIEAGTGIDQTGARAQDDGGDIISVVGNGAFNTASNKASGGGTLTHTDADGNPIATGTWKATGLQDFVFYGCGSEGLPNNFCGGFALLSVEVTGPAGTFDAILGINCKIGTVPPGSEEGITLDIPGTPFNFNDTLEESSGLTVFVSKSRS